MKFLHLSDLHIGLKLKNRDLKEDQEFIFKRIAGLASEQKPDAIVIAGDIYDKAVPSAEAVETFDSFVTLLRESCSGAVIMMISGNHDSAQRVNVFRGLLARQKVYMIGMPPRLPDEHIEKITLEDEYGPVNFYLLPFVKPATVRLIVGSGDEPLSYDEAVRRLLAREDIDQSERNVLVSHQFYLPPGKDADSVERMSSEIVTVGNIDSIGGDVLEPFDYAALGHIHKPMKVGSSAYRYCGTPFAYSVDESGQKKQAVFVTLGKKGEVSTEEFELEPLRRVRVIKDTLENVLTQGSGDYVSVVLTDSIDLDVLDMQDRLRAAFPNLLEVRREALENKIRGSFGAKQRDLSPFELCCEFLGEPTDEEKELLKDIINKAEERGSEK